MTISKNILSGAGAVEEPYVINQSLMFNEATDDSMGRTFSSGGNLEIWTYSTWFKRVNGGSIGNQLLGYTDGGGPWQQSTINVNQAGAVQIVDDKGGTGTNVATTRLLRDPASWYHIVVAFDTTQAYTYNRLKIYVNGVQETSFSTANYPARYAQPYLNRAVLHTIALGNTYNCSQYLAETHFIDGIVKTPSDFGKTNNATGQWIAKEYEGSYGTTGFYHRMASGAIGADSSSNSNTFSTTNLSNANVLTDSPTNNFAVMDPIFIGDDSNTFSEGNLKITTATTNGGLCVATFAPTAGKYYAEFKVVNFGATANSIIGVRDLGDDPLYVVSGWHNRNLTTQSAKNMGYYGYNGELHVGPSGAVLSNGASYTTNDVIGIAIDYDNSIVKWYKNNVLQHTKTSADLENVTFAFSDSSGGSGFTTECNFGQRAFAYTPPSGYVTLSTANLPAPAIALPEKHFNTALYAGNNAANRAITTGMEPDLVWLKTRNAGNWHNLFDSVRGAGAVMYSNANTAETTRSDSLTGFSSTGFTVSQNAAYNDLNASDHTYVSWNWKAGGATPVKTYAVKVVSDSGNKYRFDDFAASAQTVDMQEGGTYTFDQSDSSNSNHPLRFSVTSNGSHGGGSEYTTGVVTTGSPGSSGAKTVITVAASAPTLYYYCTNHSGMGGQANTNSTRGSTNFTGSSKGIVSANVAAGFSIVSFTGTGAWQTLGHELGVIPEVVITKARSVQQDWYWVHTKVDGTLDYMVLNTDVANANGSATVPTSSVFQTQYAANQTNIAYCFASKPGFSKIGTYLGNGRADGSMVHLGFTPAWVIIKRANVGGYWLMQDVVRDPINANNARLFGDLPDAELSHANYNIDFLSNGFKTRVNHTGMNTNASTYFYMAFAKAPFKYANAR